MESLLTRTRIKISEFERYTKEEIRYLLEDSNESYFTFDLKCRNCKKPITRKYKRKDILFNLAFYSKKILISDIKSHFCDKCLVIIKKLTKKLTKEIAKKSLEILKEQTINKDNFKVDYSNDEHKGQVVSVKRWMSQETVS